MSRNEKSHVYVVRLGSDYDQWWRYNLFVTLVGYDERANVVGYTGRTDRTFDIDAAAGVEDRLGEAVERVLEVTSEPCYYVEIYVYIIANTFPNSAIIRESPPFMATLDVSCDGVLVEHSEHEVNQWGGLSIVAHRVDASAG